MKSTRPYTQRRRAEAAADTGARIIAAATARFLSTGEEPTLEAVAGDAGVTVQTVLRRYGSKDGLMGACIAAGEAQVAAERDAVTPGDVQGAVDNLLAHYAAWGERSLRLLSLAERSASAARVVAGGKALHRAWVARAFGPQLARVAEAERTVRLAQLVAVTDVYAWALLREQLDSGDLRAAVVGLVVALVGGEG